MKTFKNIIDQAEMNFSFLNKKQLKILKSYLRIAHSQGVIDYLDKKLKERN